LPLGSRIRSRLTLQPATADDLRACLMHRMKTAGNQTLMTNGLVDTLSEHALGNYRILLTLAAELLAVGTRKALAQLDEKLYLEVFAPNAPPQKTTTGRRKC
jgi:type II secretory pathway predicted ATPase ExeA